MPALQKKDNVHVDKVKIPMLTVILTHGTSKRAQYGSNMPTLGAKKLKKGGKSPKRTGYKV